jgi:hypothetical protein
MQFNLVSILILTCAAVALVTPSGTTPAKHTTVSKPIIKKGSEEQNQTAEGEDST